MPFSPSRALLPVSFALAGIGLALLLLARHLDSGTLLKPAILCFMLGALGATLHTILKRREPISHGDEHVMAEITGTQAMLSGAAHLILVIAVLVAVAAWILGQGGELLAWSKEHSGVYPLLTGLYLMLHGLGPIVGKAVSMVGHAPLSKADSAAIALNVIAEKAISAILAIIGMLLLVLGIIALVTGKGALESALSWL